MKKINITKGLVGIGMLSLLGACSDDYLSQSPITDPSNAQIHESVAAAKLAVRGIARVMQMQYQKTNLNQYMGESYINTHFGDCWGSDVRDGLSYQMWGQDVMTWKMMGNERYNNNALPWRYGYDLIFNANGVLDGIDDAEGDADDRRLVKAQALTYRAHGYIKLLQFYAPRWEDSNNGDTYCIVKRTTQSTEPTPLVTMKEIKDLIYEDLDSAIYNYENSKSRREFKWEPDLSVAQGLYARAALLFHDWKIAADMAKNARANYTIMDNNTLYAGFYADNNDLMWTQSDEDSDIYYWSWGSHYACNGTYVKNWEDIGAGFISLELYNELDPNDVRRGLFMTPDKLKDAPADWNPGKLVPNDFWNPDLVDPTSMNMATGLTRADKNQPNKKFGLNKFIVYWGMDYMNNKFKGDLGVVIDPEDPFGAYIAQKVQANAGDPLIWLYEKGNNVKLYGCHIGAQYKFWSKAPYGTSCYPFMRASEMCLAEAEAAYMAGDYPRAQKCLSEINSLRIPGYSGGKTGQALLDEIRLCRRIELWGEGQNWTDYKRWNLPITRKAWVKRNPSSGNCPKDYSMTRDPKDCAGWRFTVPASETDYNNLIDRKLLPAPSEYLLD